MPGTEDKVKSAGDLAVEQMLEEERAHEELLYKRALLEVIRELNEKCGGATKGLLVDCA